MDGLTSARGRDETVIKLFETRAGFNSLLGRTTIQAAAKALMKMAAITKIQIWLAHFPGEGERGVAGFTPEKTAFLRVSKQKGPKRSKASGQIRLNNSDSANGDDDGNAGGNSDTVADNSGAPGIRRNCPNAGSARNNDYNNKPGPPAPENRPSTPQSEPLTNSEPPKR